MVAETDEGSCTMSDTAASPSLRSAAFHLIVCSRGNAGDNLENKTGPRKGHLVIATRHQYSKNPRQSSKAHSAHPPLGGCVISCQIFEMFTVYHWIFLGKRSRHGHLLIRCLGVQA